MLTPDHNTVGERGRVARSSLSARTPKTTLVMTPMNIVWSKESSKPSCDSVRASKSTVPLMIQDTSTGEQHQVGDQEDQSEAREQPAPASRQPGGCQHRRDRQSMPAGSDHQEVGRPGEFLVHSGDATRC